jgi:mono/diheme cytochrome c family protein
MSRPRQRPHAARAHGQQANKPAPTARRIGLIVGSIAVGVAVIAIGLSSGNRADIATAATRDPSEVAAGAELFAASCATCHGADLAGTNTGPPFLNAIYAPNHHADEAFQRAVAQGVQPHHWSFGPMVPVDGLSRDEVALIIEFVRSEQEAAGILRDPSHG